MRPDGYVCEWPDCGRSYSKPSKLDEHVRSHTNDRCFVCDVEGCRKSFLRKGHLKRHELSTHLKERPFRCEGCDAAFALKHHLTRHEKTHLSSKPFLCAFGGCSDAFAKHEQLRRHTCTMHTHEPVFQCSVCAEGFSEPRAFKRHQARAHGASRTYVCGVEECGVIFTKWSQVVEHRKSAHPRSTQPIFCEECAKGPFKSVSSLAQHTKTIHQRPSASTAGFHCIPHDCPQCAKSFSSRSNLKAHLLAIHSTLRPFACDVCETAYGYKKLLKQHIDRCHPPTCLEPDQDEFPDLFMTPPPSSISLDDLTCSSYFSDRQLCCPIDDCSRRFFRQYDLDRHLQSLHSTLEFFDE